MDRFVIDSSIAIAWVHPSQATAGTDQLLTRLETGAECLVPLLWFLEVSNALIVLQRRKKLTRKDRLEALSGLAELDLTSDDEGLRFALTRTSNIAEEHGLSLYDACYLELALRLNVPFATRDNALKESAQKAGLKILTS
jgi:predicted nucleic acid-binding protein